MRVDSSRPAGRPTAGPARADRDLSRPLPAALSWTVLTAFVAAAVAGVALLGVPLWLPGAYEVMSIVGFAAYGLDKRAAQRDGARVSEQTLLTIGLLGGWPGAVVAQQLFRHKTRKRSFRRRFWGGVAVNIALLSALVVIMTAAGWNLASLSLIG